MDAILSKRSLQTTVLLLGLSGLALLVLLFVFVRPLMESVVIAGLLAYLLDPVAHQFQRRTGLGHTAAAVSVFLTTLVTVVGFLALVSAVLWDQMQRFRVELIAVWHETIRQISTPYDFLGVRVRPQLFLDDFQQAVGNALSALFSNSGIVLGRAFDNMLWGIVILVTLFYFLKDGPKIKPWILSFVPHRCRMEGQRLLDEIDHAWSVFLRMQLFIAAVVILLSILSTSLLVWLYGSGWLPISGMGFGLLLILVLIAVQQVDNIWLRPQLMGRAFRLHPGVVFVTLIAGLALGGILGAILAVPVLATAKIIARYALAHLMGQSPRPAESEVALPPSDSIEASSSNNNEVYSA